MDHSKCSEDPQEYADSLLTERNGHLKEVSKCTCHIRYNLVKILTIISIVSSIVCVICVFVIIYLTCMKHNNYYPSSHRSMDGLRRQKLPTNEVDFQIEKISETESVFDQVHRSIRATQGSRKDRRSKRKDGAKRAVRCKCRGKRGKRGKNGKLGSNGATGATGRQGLTGDVGPQGPVGESSSLMSAHYASDFSANEKREFKSSDRCVLTESGKVCRNRTIFVTERENYKFLYPAKWVNEETGPLKQDNFGVFTVQQPGIYMIYSTTHYYDAKIMLCQVVKINDKTKFRCMDGVDSVRDDQTAFNRRHKTCSFSGVTKLEKGDTIKIQNVFPVVIDISKDRTYFGVVLLHPHVE